MKKKVLISLSLCLALGLLTISNISTVTLCLQGGGHVQCVALDNIHPRK